MVSRGLRSVNSDGMPRHGRPQSSRIWDTVIPPAVGNPAATEAASFVKFQKMMIKNDKRFNPRAGTAVATTGETLHCMKSSHSLLVSLATAFVGIAVSPFCVSFPSFLGSAAGLVSYYAVAGILMIGLADYGSRRIRSSDSRAEDAPPAGIIR
jgi:hypothetical protein